MTVLEKLAEFIRNSEEQFSASEWLSDEKMQVYVRKGHHFLGRKRRLCLDIANVEVYKKGEGTWTSFIRQAHEMNPWDGTFVECVHNSRLASWLLRNGFAPHNGVESFFLPKNPENWNERP